MTHKFKLFLDLDGLFADFDGRVKLLTGKFPWELKKGEYWKAIGKDANFFRKLEWMKDATPLWELVRQYPHAVLTGLPSSVVGKEDKRIWVDEKMTPETEALIVPKIHKQDYAAWNHVLIDDQQVNIDQWIAAGGIGIMHHRGKFDETLIRATRAIELLKMWYAFKEQPDEGPGDDLILQELIDAPLEVQIPPEGMFDLTQE